MLNASEFLCKQVILISKEESQKEKKTTLKMLFIIQEYKQGRFHVVGCSACTTAKSTASAGAMSGLEPKLGQLGNLCVP